MHKKLKWNGNNTSLGACTTRMLVSRLLGSPLHTWSWTCSMKVKARSTAQEHKAVIWRGVRTRVQCNGYTRKSLSKLDLMSLRSSPCISSSFITFPVMRLGCALNVPSHVTWMCIECSQSCAMEVQWMFPIMCHGSALDVPDQPRYQAVSLL